MIKTNQIFPLFYRGLLALLLVGAISGCRSDMPVSAGFASVIITGKTADQIEQTSVKVFGDSGYQMHRSGDDLIFEREGTQRDQVNYGSYLANKPVLERVRAQIVPLADGKFRLQCTAYIVRNPGEPALEEELKLPNYRSGPYQKILDDVASRLK
jgi:hypothetical protein